jgi:hypothetical protein
MIAAQTHCRLHPYRLSTSKYLTAAEESRTMISGDRAVAAPVENARVQNEGQDFMYQPSISRCL